MAAWVRFVWWPLMVVLTTCAVGGVIVAIARLVDGQVGAGGFSLAISVGMLAVLVREWPNWRRIGPR